MEKKIIVAKPNKKQYLKIIKYKQQLYPADGTAYVKSIKKMFTSVIRNQVLNFDAENKNNINKMFNEIENKKNSYYNYLNLDMSKITIKDLIYDDLLFTIEYKDISGILLPFSQCDTALSVIPSLLANSCCVIFLSFLHCAINFPIFC